MVPQFFFFHTPSALVSVKLWAPTVWSFPRQVHLEVGMSHTLIWHRFPGIWLCTFLVKSSTDRACPQIIFTFDDNRQFRDSSNGNDMNRFVKLSIARLGDCQSFERFGHFYR